jgi:transcriptional regulator with XRE-family HTH domain
LRRKELGLTQAQVRIRMETESVSITHAKFSRIEKGLALANVAEIVALAAALKMTYGWLWNGGDQPHIDLNK